MNTRQIRCVFRNVLCFKRKRLAVKYCLVLVFTFVLMCLVTPFQYEHQSWYYSPSDDHQLQENDPFIDQTYYTPSYEYQQEVDQFKEQRYYTPSEDVLIPLNHSFILTNAHICQQDQPYLIGIVPSRMRDFRERSAIRKTYGSMSRDKVSIVNDVSIEHVVRIVFVVGKSEDISLEMQISNENIKHRDMVQIDMIDSYYNLTLKVLMALKWVDTFCPSAKYVLKVDDDVFIHIGLLLNQIHSIKHSVYGNIFGKIYHEEKYFIVDRKYSKWAVPKEEFPLNKYPKYAQGTSYTITRDLVPKIIQKAQYLPYLRNEDVFITGVIGAQLIGAKLEPLNKTSDWVMDVPVPCLFAEDNELAQSMMTPDLMYQTWRALQENYIYCKLYRGRK